MTITLLVVDILLTISLIVAINIVKEKQQRLNAEIKHSLRLEETVEELVNLLIKELTEVLETNKSIESRITLDKELLQKMKVRKKICLLFWIC